jgi:hypothetical protein
MHAATLEEIKRRIGHAALTVAITSYPNAGAKKRQ